MRAASIVVSDRARLAEIAPQDRAARLEIAPIRQHAMHAHHVADGNSARRTAQDAGARLAALNSDLIR
jgi:SpoVK/Ycf46/Vps4 family AAA+-type ATPase